VSRLVVVGGGAAGVFGAIAASSAARGRIRTTVLEAGPLPLAKVKISGGGRCNVMHDERKPPSELSPNYPRGSRELEGALERFGATESAAWFRRRGLRLKTESDGRMFPTTDSSQSVIDVLLAAARDEAVHIRTRTRVVGLRREGASFVVEVASGSGARREAIEADFVLLAPGASKAAWAWSSALGHNVLDPVPSLFTLNLDAMVDQGWLSGLAGITLPHVQVMVKTEEASADVGEHSVDGPGGWSPPRGGPLLFTHSGVSGGDPTDICL